MLQNHATVNVTFSRMLRTNRTDKRFQIAGIDLLQESLRSVSDELGKLGNVLFFTIFVGRCSAKFATH